MLKSLNTLDFSYFLGLPQLCPCLGWTRIALRSTAQHAWHWGGDVRPHRSVRFFQFSDFLKWSRPKRSFTFSLEIMKFEDKWWTPISKKLVCNTLRTPFADP